MSEIEHDVVTELPGAPAVPEEPITFEAPWHNAGSTGAYTEPEVAPVVAYEKPVGDSPMVAKVLEPPARPTPRGGRQAETKGKPKASAAVETPQVEAPDDGGQADADGAAQAPEGA